MKRTKRAREDGAHDEPTTADDAATTAPGGASGDDAGQDGPQGPDGDPGAAVAPEGAGSGDGGAPAATPPADGADDAAAARRAHRAKLERERRARLKRAGNRAAQLRSEAEAGEPAAIAAATASARAATPARGRKGKAARQEETRAAAAQLCTAIAAATFAIIPERFGGGAAPDDSATIGDAWAPILAPYLEPAEGDGQTVPLVLACLVTGQVLIVRVLAARERERQRETFVRDATPAPVAPAATNGGAPRFDRSQYDPPAGM